MAQRNRVKKKKQQQQQQQRMRRNKAKHHQQQRQTVVAPNEFLPEMAWEILIRLPAKTLARFKLVSKAWHATISDPAFVRAHLERSKQRKLQNPESSFSFITLQIIHHPPQEQDPPQAAVAAASSVRFYQLSSAPQQQQDDTMVKKKKKKKKKKKRNSTATLLDERHFRAGEFTQAAPMAHCDGLVLLPTDTNAYVFNPATRDSISLPESSRNMMRQQDPRTCLPTGLGYDASTGRYKVARAFYRSGDYSHTAMGMEVFTINGVDDEEEDQEDGSNRGWRETHEDSPCLIWCPQTPLHHKGHLLYFTDTKNQQPSSLPLGLLRFSLESETFGFTPLLDDMFPPRAEDGGSIVIHELHGELCATLFCKQAERLFVWVARDVLDPRWGLRYTISVSEPCCYPAASLGNGGFLMRGRGRNCLFRYCSRDQQAVKEDDVFDLGGLRFVGGDEDTAGLCSACGDSFFSLMFYTESLVPLVTKASLHAL